MTNQRRGLDRAIVLWHLEISGVSHNTAKISKHKKTSSWTPNDQSNRQDYVQSQPTKSPAIAAMHDPHGLVRSVKFTTLMVTNPMNLLP